MLRFTDDSWIPILLTRDLALVPRTDPNSFRTAFPLPTSTPHNYHHLTAMTLAREGGRCSRPKFSSLAKKEPIYFHLGYTTERSR